MTPTPPVLQLRPECPGRPVDKTHTLAEDAERGIFTGGNRKRWGVFVGRELGRAYGGIVNWMDVRSLFVFGDAALAWLYC